MVQDRALVVQRLLQVADRSVQEVRVRIDRSIVWLTAEALL
jgi:hypothetical protein